MYVHPVYISFGGFIVLLLGLIWGLYLIPILERYLIRKSIALEEGNPSFDIWRQSPFPIKFKIRFFNVSNPDEIVNGEQPIVEEVGPYIYDEFVQRRIISTDNENDTIEYYRTKNYVFNSKESLGKSDEDFVTIINAGLMGLAIQIYTNAPMAVGLLNNALPYLYQDFKNPFIRGRVKDVLFDGLELRCEAPEVKMICKILKNRKPPTIRQSENNRDYLVAMFHHLNNTEDGPFVMRRGITKSTIRGELVSYQNEDHISIWAENGTCNQIRGSDLSLLNPYEEKPNDIEFFAQNLCRSLKANYIEDDNSTGMVTYKFMIRNPLGKFGADEKCFCVTTDDSEGLPKCSLEGTMYMTPCLKSPVLVSMPHFYLGDPILKGFVRNLEPDEKKHATVLNIEPKTATPISIKTRFQMNIELKQIPGISVLENVNEGVFPIIWMEEGGDIPPAILIKLKENLEKLGKFIYVQWALVGIGLVLMVVGIFFTNKQSLYMRLCVKNAVTVEKLHPVSNSMDTERYVNNFLKRSEIAVINFD